MVSALNGLAPTMLDLQGRLLDAAAAAQVPRLMPFDFSLDFTKTRPGDNRNMDLRRAFQARIDAAPIQATSVLNGAFAGPVDRGGADRAAQNCTASFNGAMPINGPPLGKD